MAKTKHYYNSLPECSIIDINYGIIPLPEAALLWCGVKPDELAEEMQFISLISQSIYKHPYIPCFEKKTRVLTNAVNNGKLRAVREHGEGGEANDRVAYHRRHFLIEDFKKFITDNYPNDRPKTIFHEEELKPIIDLTEYERMSKEYQKFLSENTNLQTKINELKTEIASKDSKIGDSELALLQLSTQVQQAKSAQQTAEERLDKAKDYYLAQKKEIEDKNNRITELEKIIAGLKQNQEKEVTGKAEAAYLNIIKGLNDIVLADGKNRNQAWIIGTLLANNPNTTGISESNLKNKFAEANKL